MYKRKRILAIIPAREGSKRLKRKNAKPLCGKPLIAWTIDAAKKSRYIDKVIISTDSSEIASISEKYGAEIPFLRPGKLSGDKSLSEDVVLHAVNLLSKKGCEFDIIVMLQPTSPLRRHSDIDRAIRILFDKDAQAVVSVVKTMYPPSWMNTLSSDGNMKGFFSAKRSEVHNATLSKYFMPNGAVFVVYVDHIKKSKRFYGNRTYAYIMPRERSVDIDDIFDFKVAESMMVGETRADA